MDLVPKVMEMTGLDGDLFLVLIGLGWAWAEGLRTHGEHCDQSIYSSRHDGGGYLLHESSGDGRQ